MNISSKIIQWLAVKNRWDWEWWQWFDLHTKNKNSITDTMDESGKEEAILKFNSEIMELQEKENWKNKAQSPKKRKSFYLLTTLK